MYDVATVLTLTASTMSFGYVYFGPVDVCSHKRSRLSEVTPTIGFVVLRTDTIRWELTRLSLVSTFTVLPIRLRPAVRFQAVNSGRNIPVRAWA